MFMTFRHHHAAEARWSACKLKCITACECVYYLLVEVRAMRLQRERGDVAFCDASGSPRCLMSGRHHLLEGWYWQPLHMLDHHCVPGNTCAESEGEHMAYEPQDAARERGPAYNVRVRVRRKVVLLLRPIWFYFYCKLYWQQNIQTFPSVTCSLQGNRWVQYSKVNELSCLVARRPRFPPQTTPIRNKAGFQVQAYTGSPGFAQLVPGTSSSPSKMQLVIYLMLKRVLRGEGSRACWRGCSPFRQEMAQYFWLLLGHKELLQKRTHSGGLFGSSDVSIAHGCLRSLLPCLNNGALFRTVEILARRVLTVISLQKGQSGLSSAASIWAPHRQKTHASCVK